MKYLTRAEGPYPDIGGLPKNPVDAKRLMNVYGGKGGETDAILTYTYQSYVVWQSFPELASLVKQVAIVEMKHHELLGKAIFKLGGLPVIAGRNAYFSGTWPDYRTKPEDFLAANVKAEESAIAYYEAVKNAVKTDELKQLLSRIIEDEVLHVKLFSEALASL